MTTDILQATVSLPLACFPKHGQRTKHHSNNYILSRINGHNTVLKMLMSSDFFL